MKSLFAFLIFVILMVQVLAITYWLVNITNNGPTINNVFGIIINFMFGMINIKTLTILAGLK